MPEKSSKPAKAPRKSSAKKSTAKEAPANEAAAEPVAEETAVQPKETLALAQPAEPLTSAGVTANEPKGEAVEETEKAGKGSQPEAGQPEQQPAVAVSEEGSAPPKKRIKQGVRVAKKAASKKPNAESAKGEASEEDGKEQEPKPKTSGKNQKSKQPKAEKSTGSAEQASGKEADDAKSEDGGKGQTSRRSRGRGRGARQQEPKEAQAVKVDAKTVAQRAWKIFLSEVSEEGIALISDKDAHELARRSLRVAEIYSREEAIQSKKNKEKSKKKSEA